MAQRDADDLIQHRPRLVGLARHLGLSHDEAEDAAQSCLLGVLRQVRAGAPIADPQAYLNTALRHHCHRQHRARARETVLTGEHESTVPDAETGLFLSEVIAALDDLPDDQASLLRRVFEGETSPQALADESGLPVGTVMSRLARGRATLRRRLGLDIDNIRRAPPP